MSLPKRVLSWLKMIHLRNWNLTLELSSQSTIMLMNGNLMKQTTNWWEFTNDQEEVCLLLVLDVLLNWTNSREFEPLTWTMDKVRQTRSWTLTSRTCQNQILDRMSFGKVELFFSSTHLLLVVGIWLKDHLQVFQLQPLRLWTLSRFKTLKSLRTLHGSHESDTLRNYAVHWMKTWPARNWRPNCCHVLPYLRANWLFLCPRSNRWWTKDWWLLVSTSNCMCQIPLSIKKHAVWAWLHWRRTSGGPIWFIALDCFCEITGQTQEWWNDLLQLVERRRSENWPIWSRTWCRP